MATKSEIEQVQQSLHLRKTGILDELTQAAIRNYQIKNNLPVTGNIDSELTAELLDSGLSSDLSEQYNASINKYYLPPKEYMKGPTKKEYIFLHHTAGWNNPYAVVDMWAKDTRGPIGTQYVIGGINPKTGDETYDGVIVEAFPDTGYAWHLGIGNTYTHTHSVGIELCHFGWVIKSGSNYLTYTNTKVDPRFVIDLKYKFRGYQYWIKYSDEQINSLRHLITLIANKHNISTHIGLQERLKTMKPQDAFEYFDGAKLGTVKGILSHTSVIKSGKFDVFPQDELIDMIKSL